MDLSPLRRPLSLRSPRLFAVALLAVAVTLISCDTEITDPGRSAPGLVPATSISDALSGEADVRNPGFFWLPPAVRQPPLSTLGTFHGGLSPKVEVVCLSRTENGTPLGDADCDGDDVVRTYNRDAGLREESEHYQADLETAGLEVSGGDEVMSTYRVIAYTDPLTDLGGPFELGHLDFRLESPGGGRGAPPGRSRGADGPRGSQDSEVLVLQPGRTLPLRFRIDRGAYEFEIQQNAVTVPDEPGDPLCQVNCSVTLIAPDQPTEASLVDEATGEEATAVLFPAGAIDVPAVLIIDERPTEGPNASCAPGYTPAAAANCFRYVLSGYEGDFEVDVPVGICPVGITLGPGTLWDLVKIDYVEGEPEVTFPPEYDASDFLPCDSSTGEAVGFLHRVLDWLVPTAYAGDTRIWGATIRDFSELLWAQDAALEMDPLPETAAVGSTIPVRARWVATHPTMHGDDPVGIAGAEVTFTVGTGGGELLAPEGTEPVDEVLDPDGRATALTFLTDADGYATVDWQVGSGSNGLTTARGDAATTSTVTVADLSSVRVEANADGSVSTTFASVAQAVASVASGGTVTIADGRHVVQDVQVDRPMTIIGEGTSQPVVDADGAGRSFTVRNVESGLVRFSGLRFQNAGFANLHVDGTIDSLIIEQSEFAPSNGEPNEAGLSYNSGIFVWGPDAAEIIVRNNGFTGGDIGVHTNFDPISNARTGVVVMDNRFSGQTNAAVHGPVDRVEGNAVTNCGPHWCMFLMSDEPIHTDVVGNQVTTAGLVRVPITIGTVETSTFGTATLSQNVVTMTTADGVPYEPAGDDGLWAGLDVWNLSEVEFTSNVIENVHAGISIGGGIGEASANDNRIRNTHVGIHVNPDHGPAQFTRNDVVDYDRPMDVPVPPIDALDLTCNWWGSAVGPIEVDPEVDPGVYTPWAEEPVAGTDATECTGVAPASVRVDPAAVGNDPYSFATISDALSVVAEGGTITFSDGNHVVQNIRLTQPINIQGDGNTMPVLDAQGGGNSFWMDGMDAGPVTIRGVEFRNTYGTVPDPEAYWFGSVKISGSYDQVLIENVHFYPADPPNSSEGDAFDGNGVWADAIGNGITIRASTFTGGDIGVNGANVTSLLVENSTFTGQAQGGVHTGGIAVVRGNQFSDCGLSCVAGGGDITVHDNDFAVDISNPIEHAVNFWESSRVVVADNRITGTGGAANPNDSRSWPITVAGISLYQVAEAVVSGNTIRHAHAGVWFDQTTAAGSDNVIDDVAIGIGGWGPDGAFSNVTMQSSDITNYSTAIDGSYSFESLDLTCNWWGSPLGPSNVEQGFEPATYTPWAQEPVAGTGTTSCSGAAPSSVAVDPEADGSDPYTFPTLEEAFAAVAKGGTITLQPGTHYSGGIGIDRSVTITGDPADRSATTLIKQGNDNPILLGITGGRVTIRHLSFTETRLPIALVPPNTDEVYESLTIEDVHIVLPPADDSRQIWPTGVAAWGPIALGSAPADIVISNSTIEGGFHGVQALGAVPGLEIRNNTFLNQNQGGRGVELGAGVWATVTGNEFSGCHSCIHAGESDRTAGGFLIESNTITAHYDEIGPGYVAIHAAGQTPYVRRNTVTGVGGPQDPSDGANWPFNIAIKIDGAQNATITENHVSGAWDAYHFTGNVGTTTASDNTATDVAFAIAIQSPTTGAIDFQSSDFTGYAQPIGLDMAGPDGDALESGALTLDLTCNWWGSETGPAPIDQSIPSTIYSPWARSQVAGTGTTSCSGGEAPSVDIAAPADGTTVEEGTAIALTGTARDTLGQDLTPSIGWNSDLDGSLGTGGTVIVTLSVGAHEITASVTENGRTGSDTVSVTVTANDQPPSSASIAYVANTASDDLSVIDVATSTVTRAIPVGDSPISVAMAPAGQIAYVVNRDSENVSVISVATGTVTETIGVGLSPSSVAFAPDGTTAFVTNAGSNSVSVIDIESGAVSRTFAVGEVPRSVAFTPDGSTALVANSGSNDVSVVDVESGSVQRTIAVGSVPMGVAVVPDGRAAYVVNLSSNNVSMIDLTTGTVTGTTAVGTQPWSLAITPDGSTAYVPNRSSNDVYVIDLASGNVRDIIAPIGAPQAVAFSPDGRIAYVTNGTTGVSVIDVSTGSVTGTILVGTSPSAVTFSQ